MTSRTYDYVKVISACHACRNMPFSIHKSHCRTGNNAPQGIFSGLVQMSLLPSLATCKHWQDIWQYNVSLELI